MIRTIAITVNVGHAGIMTMTIITTLVHADTASLAHPVTMIITHNDTDAAVLGMMIVMLPKMAIPGTAMADACADPSQRPQQRIVLNLVHHLCYILPPYTTVGGIPVVPPTREGEQPTEHDGGTRPPQRPFEDAARPAGIRDEPEDPDRPGRQRDTEEEPQRRRSDEEEPRRRRSDEEEPRRRRSDEEEPRRRRSDEESPDTERHRLDREGSRRRRPSDHTAYSGEPFEYGDGRRRPSPSIHTPRPDYSDGGPAVPHPYPPHPPQSPVPPTIIRLGGEMDPRFVSPPPRSHRHHAGKLISISYQTGLKFHF